MKRPLGTEDAAEDKSFKMLVYDDYKSLDGQTIEFVKQVLMLWFFIARVWIFWRAN